MTVARVLARTVAAAVLVLLAGPLGWQLISGDSYLTVEGDSMDPTYRRGDVLVVQRAHGRELAQLGTVVIVAWDPADPDGARYVHRVVEPLADGTAWLQGDGNPARDPRPVTQSQVVGTPRLVIAGDAAGLLTGSQSWQGRVVLAAVALALLLLPLRSRSTAVPGDPVDPATPAGPSAARHRAAAGRPLSRKDP